MPQSVLSLLILAVVIFFFVTRIIPLGITALLGALAMAAAGIISFGEALSPFGSDTVMLILGMIVVGNALNETGCTEIIGRAVTRIPHIGQSERLFLVVVTLVVGVLSGFMSNTATVAIFLPIVASVSQASGGIINKKNSCMAVGIASVIGGNLTLAGSTPQLVAQGVLEQTEGCEPMAFFDLAKGALPLMIIMALFYATFGYSLQKKKFNFEESVFGTETAITQLDKKKACIVGVIFIFSAMCFIFEIATLGAVAITAGCLCVVTGCISIERAAETMDWTSVMVLGGSLGFSKGLSKGGALNLLADTVIELIGSAATPFMMLALFLILSMVVSNLMSHTAAAAILVPIAVSMAMEMGSNPSTFAIAVVIGCGTAFATPISTPPVTMTLSCGYRFSDYLAVGGTLGILCLITALFILPMVYGL